MLEPWAVVVSSKNSEGDIFIIRAQDLRRMLRIIRCYLKALSSLGLEDRQMVNRVHLTQMSHFKQEGGCSHTCWSLVIELSMQMSMRTGSCTQLEATKENLITGVMWDHLSAWQLTRGNYLAFLADSSGWTCKVGRKVSRKHAKQSGWEQLPFKEEIRVH